ncbi:MAG: type III pantothenate kinase [Synechococcaceae cyanobacterium ELA263]
MSGAARRWLLIGNSRWHWAVDRGDGLSIDHELPPLAALEPGLLADLVGWAAVGALPPPVLLPSQRRLQLDRVPLAGVPPWLGLDRALAGWLAWRRHGQGVLVADAGTVLSLTRVESSGRFGGGRLLAGVGLQLQAMAQGTAALPLLELPLLALPLEDGVGSARAAAIDWPMQTGRAMATGVVWGLAAAVADAALGALEHEPGCRLVLSGGDGALLQPRLQELLGAHGVLVDLQPDLALEALVELQPN